MVYTLKKNILPTTTDIEEVTFSFNKLYLPWIRYSICFYLCSFDLHLLNQSQLFSPKKSTRKKYWFINLFWSWCILELSTVWTQNDLHSCLFQKGFIFSHHFPPSSPIDFQSGKTFIYQPGDVKHNPILFSRLGSFFSQLFVSDEFEKQRKEHSNKWAALYFFITFFFFFFDIEHKSIHSKIQDQSLRSCMVM